MSTPERYQRPLLRFNRFGGGYRREDVEFALAELRLTLRQLDNDLESLRDRNRDLEGELQNARNEIESLRGKEHELSQTVASAVHRAADIEEGANARAREIIAQAEEAAMRIRSEASSRIEDSSEQFNELLRLKDNLLDAMRSVVGDFDQAISRVERGEQLFPGLMQAVPGEEPSQAAATPERPAVPFPPPLPVERTPTPTPEPVAETPAPVFVPTPVPLPEPPAQAPPVPETQPVAAEPPAAAPVTPQPPPVPDAVSIPAAPPPPLAPDPVPAAPTEPPAAQAPPPPVPAPTASAPAEPERTEEPVFDTRIELDAGPFSDFAALSAFERALAHLPKVEDVYVRRLADDRALIELTLSEPAPLLDTMRASLPYSLDVRSANRNKIVLNVAVQQPAGAR